MDSGFSRKSKFTIDPQIERVITGYLSKIIHGERTPLKCSLIRERDPIRSDEKQLNDRVFKGKPSFSASIARFRSCLRLLQLAIYSAYHRGARKCQASGKRKYANMQSGLHIKYAFAPQNEGINHNHTVTAP